MKKTIYFLSVGLLVLLTTTGLAQTAQRPKSKLEAIAHRLDGSLYERIIPLGYIPSPGSYTEKEVVGHLEYTMVVFRFSRFEPVADTTAYVGQLFMSERYLERDYNKKYDSVRKYHDDKDGFFVACKLFFDERTLEYRLNIYPDHSLNICRGVSSLDNVAKGMHYNQRVCTSMNEHWQSLKHVLAIPDIHYDQVSYNRFTNWEQLYDFRQFLKPNNSWVNIRSLPSPHTGRPDESAEAGLLSPKQINPLPEINLRKHIKCFHVGNIGDDPATIGQTLKLRFTKYSLSDDLIEGLEYTYERIDPATLTDVVLADRAKRGTFVTRNPLYRSLIVSPAPDDNFVPGIDLDTRLTLAYFGGIEPVQPHSQTAVTTSEIIKGQDKYVADFQKQTPETVVSEATLEEGKIAISSSDTTNQHWLYGGRFKPGTVPRSYAKDSLFRSPSNRYLRKTMPTFNTASKLWVKGLIKFKVNQDGYARPNEIWRIIAKETLSQDNITHVWLYIEPAIPVPKKHRK